METLPHIDPIATAIARLAEHLSPVEAERCLTEQASGRVLAESICADRDSPAIDVSAMDGYAIRLADLSQLHSQTETSSEPQRLAMPVAAIAAAGAAPVRLPQGAAVQIFTGAAVPAGADCVVRREDTLEAKGEVKFLVSVESLRVGQSIRRRGENIQAGQTVVSQGSVLSAPVMGAIATFAPRQLLVQRRVRVVVLNTGDELARIGQPVEPWQIRDSNGPLLEAWLKQMPWLELVDHRHVSDSLESVMSAIAEQLSVADAILLTGGVSMGDTDFVPEAIAKLGGEAIFHRLPIRPGKPVLGASLGGKLILGLPGNPVSVAVTSRVIGLPMLRKLAGISPIEEALPHCMLSEPDDKQLPLVWYRLVKVAEDSSVRFVDSQGSGDLVSLAQSDGFVEIPTGASGAGPWQVRWW